MFTSITQLFIGLHFVMFLVNVKVYNQFNHRFTHALNALQYLKTYLLINVENLQSNKDVCNLQYIFYFMQAQQKVS